MLHFKWDTLLIVQYLKKYQFFRNFFQIVLLKLVMNISESKFKCVRGCQVCVRRWDSRGSINIPINLLSIFFKKEKNWGKTSKPKPTEYLQTSTFFTKISNDFWRNFQGCIYWNCERLFYVAFSEMVECHAKRYLLPLIVIEAGTQNWRIIFLSHIQFFNSKYRW